MRKQGQGYVDYMEEKLDWPVGPVVENPPPVPAPAPVSMQGRFIRLEPLADGIHREDLYQTLIADDPDGRVFAYIPAGPCSNRAACGFAD